MQIIYSAINELKIFCALWWSYFGIVLVCLSGILEATRLLFDVGCWLNFIEVVSNFLETVRLLFLNILEFVPVKSTLTVLVKFAEDLTGKSAHYCHCCLLAHFALLFYHFIENVQTELNEFLVIDLTVLVYIKLIIHLLEVQIEVGWSLTWRTHQVGDIFKAVYGAATVLI